MPDDLTTVRKIIAEHHTIRSHLKLVGDSVNDLEAQMGLQRVHSGWGPASVEQLAGKRKDLERTLKVFAEGLRSHFDFEESTLSPMLGPVLSRAMMLRHRNLRRALENAEGTVTGIKLEGLSQEELLTRKAQLEQIIQNIRRLVEEHAASEDLLLTMLEKGLENKEL